MGGGVDTGQSVDTLCEPRLASGRQHGAGRVRGVVRVAVSRGAVRQWAARRPRIAAGAAAGVVAALAGGALSMLQAAPRPHPAAAPSPPPVRARVYTDFSACLLTGPDGLTAAGAASAWAGLQAASTATSAQVSYVRLQGAQTAANADAYVTALALRGCSVIVAAGTAADQGVKDRAGALARTSFIVVVVADAAAPAPNVTAVPADTPAAISGRIKALITAAARRGGGNGQPTAATR